MMGGGGGGGSGVVGPQQQAGQSSRATSSASEACASDPAKRFSCQVLASTEDTWTQVFQGNGQRYQAPGMEFYTRSGQSGCGQAQSAMGPFYCPIDEKVYLDLGFFSELRSRFGAQGDFAQAYVITHEIGHHVQHILGTDARVRQLQESRPRQANELSVRLELQADCYAGVWGRSTQQRDKLEQGDIEEGLNAAASVGDDRILAQSGRHVNSDSFTHGSSQQRVSWFRKGFETGDPRACDTFGGTGG
jgi:predicted metalloprotease